MTVLNELKAEFPALPANEKLARLIISAFAAQLNPTVEELEDIKTAVSEAVTNCIIHGYEDKPLPVFFQASITSDSEIVITVKDEGIGIPDVDAAMEPFFTSKPDQERSGMGFTVMASFMDGLSVESRPGKGTIVTMRKRIGSQE